jgi:cob(I)alamin adenosyltransferase
VRIYTRTGDDGTTGLFGGARVHKHDVRVEAYGAIDELSCFVGVARSLEPPGDLDEILADMQRDLFAIGAELACAPGAEARLRIALVGPADTTRLEGLLDRLESELEPLRAFVLPGGSALAAALHACRAVARRAERRVSALGEEPGPAPVRPEVLAYLNRLSDLLFVLARAANRRAGRADVPSRA